MTEDTPLEPIAPEPVTEPVTAEVAPVTEPVPTAAAGGTAGTVGSWPVPGASGPPPRSSTVAVPKWLLLVVAAIVIAGIGFGVGYAVAPGGDNDNAAFRVPRGFTPPFRNGNGTNDGNGNSNDGNASGGNSNNGSGNGGGTETQPTNPSTPSTPSRGGFLGVATTESSNPAGAKIERVVAGTPAANGGLKVDDVITKVDDDAVMSPAELAERIGAHQPGDQVTITYVREGTTATARVTLARSSIELPTPSTTKPQL